MKELEFLKESESSIIEAETTVCQLAEGKREKAINLVIGQFSSHSEEVEICLTLTDLKKIIEVLENEPEV
jgi:hypothetical protein